MDKGDKKALPKLAADKTICQIIFRLQSGQAFNSNSEVCMGHSAMWSTVQFITQKGFFLRGLRYFYLAPINASNQPIAVTIESKGEGLTKEEKEEALMEFLEDPAQFPPREGTHKYGGWIIVANSAFGHASLQAKLDKEKEGRVSRPSENINAKLLQTNYWRRQWEYPERPNIHSSDHRRKRIKVESIRKRDMAQRALNLQMARLRAGEPPPTNRENRGEFLFCCLSFARTLFSLSKRLVAAEKEPATQVPQRAR